MADISSKNGLFPALLLSLVAFPGGATQAQPTDPGLRHSASDNGPPAALPGLGQDELDYFDDGLARFQVIEVVSGADATQGNGLGPRFNSNSCVSCHQQPNAAGSSPAVNPLLSIATDTGRATRCRGSSRQRAGARGALRQSNGRPDGGVHDLFVVSGRADAGSCASRNRASCRRAIR